ncbi:glycosyl hydrolase family 18 protein [Bacillus sp. T3]|uniref:glycosyl hydrolase family 18 protein n=1 Tax=Bacillus sp. T3 TaxID=467262 RepID=UPI002982298F|nr:glycosyl hydrolase family 18 protein [Bacillus sp. T3]
MKAHNRHFPLKLLFFMITLILMGSLINFNVVEAAKPDRIAPTAPTNLHATGISDTKISLAWNSSTDNTGVKAYDIYQNNNLIGNTTSTQFTVQNLSSNTAYSFYVRARDLSGNVSALSNTIKVTTAASIIDASPQVGSIQISPIASDGQTISGTVTLSVTASDDKGISKVEFYSNNGGYLIKTVTTAPYSVNWATDPWVPDGEQTLKAIVYDTSNQISQTSKTVIVKNLVTPIPNTLKKVGYYTGWSTYSNYQVANIDASKLTHLNYAFANISADGKIALGDSWADVEKPFPGDTADQPYKGNFYQLTKLKQQYPQLKTLISVGGWTWSERFSDVALTEESRTVFADSLLQFILKYNFNGVDLDWEYPVSRWRIRQY